MKMLRIFTNDARRACDYTRDRVSNGKLPYQNTPLGKGSVKNGMLPPPGGFVRNPMTVIRFRTCTYFKKI